MTDDNKEKDKDRLPTPHPALILVNGNKLEEDKGDFYEVTGKHLGIRRGQPKNYFNTGKCRKQLQGCRPRPGHAPTRRRSLLRPTPPQPQLPLPPAAAALPSRSSSLSHRWQQPEQAGPRASRCPLLPRLERARIEAYLRNIVGSVTDHCSKASHTFSSFPEAVKNTFKKTKTLAKKEESMIPRSKRNREVNMKRSEGKISMRDTLKAQKEPIHTGNGEKKA
ncbi:uncharacterized protein LOC125120752 [Phacochoerus africanus]|uniref:uncharacterized protein LOC125120752 n=1 Tax=Phacochoerus africanus TaxID=41426 RepID=UPI001FDA2FFF|nr:uncharacterized protein LOC125120752 [Phacochoerus africanus]